MSPTTWPDYEVGIQPSARNRYSVARPAADLSILSFELGLFAGMAIYNQALWQPPRSQDSAAYWFLMQLSMIVGFFTAISVNTWLFRKGWKEAM